MAAAKKAALVCIDIQNDFCDEPMGSLGIKGSRAIAPVWNELLSMPFALKVATRDCHPADHISFASQHSGKEPFKDSITVPNPENPAEPFTSTLWARPLRRQHQTAMSSSPTSISRRSSTSSTKARTRESSRTARSVLRTATQRLEIPSWLICFGSMTSQTSSSWVWAYEICVMYTAKDAVEYGFRSFIVDEGAGFAITTDDHMATTQKTLRDSGVSVVALRVQGG